MPAPDRVLWSHKPDRITFADVKAIDGSYFRIELLRCNRWPLGKNHDFDEQDLFRTEAGRWVIAQTQYLPKIEETPRGQSCEWLLVGCHWYEIPRTEAEERLRAVGRALPSGSPTARPMTTAERIPTRHDLEQLHGQVTELLALILMPVKARNATNQLSLMTAIWLIQQFTTKPPSFHAMGTDETMTTVKGWSPSVSAALIKLRELASKLHEFWGFDRPKSQEPRPHLVLADDLIQVLAWARRVLSEALEESFRMDIPPPAAGSLGCGDWEVDGQIIETLRQAGKRLTTTPLIAEMQKRGYNASESTVKKRLPLLVNAGRVDNDPKARPRGYGLPEWSPRY